MKIDFNNIPLESIPHFKGGELSFDARMHVDGLNRIIRGRLVPGASIGMHTHADSSEIIYVTSGRGTVICDGREETILPGECHYCPKGSAHSFINRDDTDLEFFAVVPNQ